MADEQKKCRYCGKNLKYIAFGWYAPSAPEPYWCGLRPGRKPHAPE